ncbi:MAG: hypothetical protein ACYS0D_02880 [Planctomycetota bacterium]
MEPQPFDFNVILYADRGDGNAPTGGPDDPTATALYVETFSHDEVHQTPTGDPDRFTYYVLLTDPFVVAADTKYWLAVQGIGDFPPNWGWSATSGITLHEAVMGYPLIGVPYWTNTSSELGTAYDMSFQLVGTAVAEPCPWDLDGSGSVGTSDLLDLLSQWGTFPGGPPDFDGRGVGTSDLLDLLANWGPCP